MANAGPAWFNGSVVDAISSAKSKSANLIVYVSGM